jgi:thiamine pyrophosphate-dependent acetolactate synthase large subunit-like protein
MMTAPSGGYAVVQALRDSGVELIFGIPGTHNLEIYRYLADSGIRHVAPRHEQGGGYAADGYARATGRPGVLLTTSGPGLTNACTAAATAYADSIPMLVISPGVPRGLEGADVGWLHEVKDQSGHMNCLLDRSIRVDTAAEAYDAIASTIRDWAVRRARPAHIEIPVDVLEEAMDPSTLQSPAQPVKPPQPTSTDLDGAAAALQRDGSLIIVVGGGSRRAAEPLRQLAEALDAVVITTVNGKGVLPEQHPLSLGASIRLPEAQRFINDADVLLIAGSELGDSDLWGGVLKPTGTVIRIDIDAAQLHKNVAADIALHGDSAATLTALAERVAGGSAVERLAPRAAELRRELDTAALRDGQPWAAFHEALVAALPPDTIVAGDSAKVSYFGTVHQWPMQQPGQFLYPAGYATLGYGLPAAIGAAVGCPDRPVIVLAGDGGTMFTVQEFCTAVDLGLSLPVIVMNNGGYGEIRDEMRQRGIAPVAVDVRSPEFAALGRACGGRGARVGTPDELSAAVLEALGESVPTMIEVDVRP